MSFRMRPEETKKAQVEGIISLAADNMILFLSVESLTIKEFEDGTEVSCSFSETRKGKSKTKRFKCKTEGVVNALFNGLLKTYCPEFLSLKNIRFSAFSIEADFNTKKTSSGADCEALVILETRNKENKIMTFRHRGRSINSSISAVVFDAVGFYVNCEIAFKLLRIRIKEARSRERHDIADGYMSQIVEIVNVASFKIEDDL